jgi:phosphatidylserine/phosphatidylglycerophosphate/cardiolipin synthase-like enzyme
VTITGQRIRADARAEPYELTGLPFGSAVLQPSHRAQIDQLARRILASWSTARPARAIRVVGHTDPVGTGRANMALGQRRAETVRRELLASLERYRRGSSGQLQVQAASRGELDQVPGSPALNRRVQVFFFAAPGPVTTTSPFTLPADPGNCLWPARTATGVQFLCPGEKAINEMVNLLVTQGQRSDAVIYLANWYLEHDMKFPGGGTLGHLLSRCAAKGATIRALVWSGVIHRPPNVPALSWIPLIIWDKLVREATSRFFSGPKVNAAAVDFINTLPRARAILDNETLPFGSHHQKILVVANPDRTVAITGGVEWNSNRLRPQKTEPGTPLFDVSVRLDGAAAGDIAELFEQRWCAVAPLGPAAPPLLACGLPRRPPVSTGPGGRPGGGATVQVGANYGCGRPLRTIPRPVTGASNLIDNLVSNCRRFFYMECQYGTGNDWLFNSIKQAFANGAQFGIVVLPAREIVSDIPEIAYWRHRFWSRFPQADGKLLVFERLDDKGGLTGPHAYVHSKLVLVDDQAASVGTLNLSQRSWRYDSEVTAIITDAPELLRAFRVKLWSQHLTLGSKDNIVDPAAALKLWQAVHTGYRAMPRLRPVHMAGNPPGRWSGQIVGRLSKDWVTKLLITGKINSVLDRVHTEIFDPAVSNCSPAAVSSRPSAAPMRA